MTLSLKVKIALIIIIQTLVLFGMVAKKQWTLTYGAPVLLETKPVDPRSLFRGDYVRIRYNISTIDKNSVLKDENLEKNEYLFVILEQQGKFWTAVEVRRDRPTLKSNQVAVRGLVEYSYGDQLNLKYGIENYFIPEGTGMALERPKNNEKVTMQIMVDSYGNAAIKQVIVNDKVIYTESLF